MTMDGWHSYKPILAHVCRKKNPGRILEWGPGESTDLMLAETSGSHITTIEHDDYWYRKAQQRFQGQRRISLIKESIVDPRNPGGSTFYCTYPFLTANRWFDLIFIDGRCRPDCITLANHAYSNEDTIAIVHDSDRRNYQRAIEKWQHFIYFSKERTAVMSHEPLTIMEDYK